MRDTPPLSPASTDKKAEQISARTEKETARRTSYAWRSQASRETRAAWADYIDRPL